MDFFLLFQINGFRPNNAVTRDGQAIGQFDCGTPTTIDCHTPPDAGHPFRELIFFVVGWWDRPATGGQAFLVAIRMATLPVITSVNRTTRALARVVRFRFLICATGPDASRPLGDCVGQP